MENDKQIRKLKKINHHHKVKNFIPQHCPRHPILTSNDQILQKTFHLLEDQKTQTAKLILQKESQNYVQKIEEEGWPITAAANQYSQINYFNINKYNLHKSQYGLNNNNNKQGYCKSNIHSKTMVDFQPTANKILSTQMVKQTIQQTNIDDFRRSLSVDKDNIKKSSSLLTNYRKEEHFKSNQNAVNSHIKNIKKNSQNFIGQNITVISQISHSKKSRTKVSTISTINSKKQQQKLTKNHKLKTYIMNLELIKNKKKYNLNKCNSIYIHKNYKSLVRNPQEIISNDKSQQKIHTIIVEEQLKKIQNYRHLKYQFQKLKILLKKQHKNQKQRVFQSPIKINIT